MMIKESQFKYDVFLSHSSKDKSIVKQLAVKLKESGLKVWFDEWIVQPGDDIYIAIEKGLEESRILVLCLSPSALKSDWVGLERSTVLFRDPSNINRRFIPLLLCECVLPDTLKRYKYIDYKSDVVKATEELLSACGLGTDVENILWQSNKSLSEASVKSKELEEKIKEAKKAKRLRDFTKCLSILNEVLETAENSDNKKIAIRARLEKAFIQVEDGLDLDEALSSAESCLAEAKNIDLGNQIGSVLQLLGEIHRIKGNPDKARGFLNAALELGRMNGNKNAEGWALLALSNFNNQTNESSNIALDYIKQAFDCFTNDYVSGDDDAAQTTNEGHAMCHILRASIYDYHRVDEAIAEYTNAIEIYQKMDESWEWYIAKTLFDRGELQARTDDAQQSVLDLFAASKVFNKLGDLIMEAKCIMEGAELLDKKGHRKESEIYFKRAAEIASSHPDERKSGWFFLRYAMKLIELQHYDSAKEILLMLLSRDWIKDSQKLDVLENLSMMAQAQNNEKELKEYEGASLNILDQLISEAHTIKDRVRLLVKKGRSLAHQNQYDLAVETYQRAIRAYESNSDIDGMAECWSAIASIKNKMKNQKEEREAYKQVLKLIGDDEDSVQLIPALTMLAQLEIREGHLSEAKLLLNKAETASKKNMPFMMFVIQDIRKRLAEKENNKNV